MNFIPILIPHTNWLNQTLVHCSRFPTAASRGSPGIFSPDVGAHSLKSPTNRRLDLFLPSQLPNLIEAHFSIDLFFILFFYYSFY